MSLCNYSVYSCVAECAHEVLYIHVPVLYVYANVCIVCICEQLWKRKICTCIPECKHVYVGVLYSHVEVQYHTAKWKL